MSRVIVIEERIRVSGGVIGETLRERKAGLDQCTVGLADLDSQVRVQEQHHDVSEHKHFGSEETHVSSFDGVVYNHR